MMKHTFQCHSKAPNFSYQCGISGCIQTFKTYSAFASHLQIKHLSFNLESSQEDILDSSYAMVRRLMKVLFQVPLMKENSEQHRRLLSCYY